MDSDNSLHYVVAFIQPFQLDSVVNALCRLRHFPGMSVSEVRGFGAHRAHPPRPGEPGEVDIFEKKLRLEVFCRVSDVVEITETVRKSARTGNPGDGKIFAGPVSSAQRIRTAASGEAAVLASADPPAAAGHDRPTPGKR